MVPDCFCLPCGIWWTNSLVKDVCFKSPVFSLHAVTYTSFLLCFFRQYTTSGLASPSQPSAMPACLPGAPLPCQRFIPFQTPFNKSLKTFLLSRCALLDPKENLQLPQNNLANYGPSRPRHNLHIDWVTSTISSVFSHSHYLHSAIPANSFPVLSPPKSPDLFLVPPDYHDLAMVFSKRLSPVLASSLTFWPRHCPSPTPREKQWKSTSVTLWLLV